MNQNCLKAKKPTKVNPRRNPSVWVAGLALILVAVGTAELPAQTRELIEQFSADENSLRFKYRNSTSPTTLNRMAGFYSFWKTRANRIEFGDLSKDEQIDIILLKNYVRQQEGSLRDRIAIGEIADRLVPFLKVAYKLLDQHEATQIMEPQKVAETFEQISKEIDEFDRAEFKNFASNQKIIIEAISKLDDAIQSLDQYNRFHQNYNPLYTWWVSQPFDKLNAKLQSFTGELKIEVYGTTKKTDKIVGQPIGRSALERELRHEFIAYSVDELLAIANREMAWCDREMKKAAQELNFRSWKEAQNNVKSKFVKPGEQPKLIHDLAIEAIGFLESNNLVTIPAIAKETWRMRMMSPERQKMSPYFLGGHTILVSYPTDGMSHQDKMMSMRGNNPHFARATVHHELIPGHHLQYFMNKRNKPYRQKFGTPFWLEGWAVYWEMLLWDLNFARSAEDRIGMLFWRKHRCARIVFSLGYHSGQMTPEECIDLLVDRVGHERNNATAEVRRSVMGGYGPLYQAAYMVGALQFRRLHEELVQSGKMTNREFHDAILKENSIPVELLRAKLLGVDLDQDFKASWQFCD